MSRWILRMFTLLGGVATTAVLLTWPRDRGHWTAGGTEVGGFRSAVEPRVTDYGLVPYLRVIEATGIAQPQRWSLLFDPGRTVATGVLVVAIWVAVVCLLQHSRGIGCGANRHEP